MRALASKWVTLYFRNNPPPRPHRWQAGNPGVRGGDQDGLEIQVGRGGGGGVQARKFFFRGHFYRCIKD